MTNQQPIRLTPYEIQQQILRTMGQGWHFLILGPAAFWPFAMKCAEFIGPVKDGIRQWKISLSGHPHILVAAFNPKSLTLRDLTRIMQEEGEMVGGTTPTEEEIVAAADEATFFVPVDNAVPNYLEVQEQTRSFFHAFISSSFDHPGKPFNPLKPDEPCFVPTCMSRTMRAVLPEVVMKTPWLETGDMLNPWIRAIGWQFFTPTGEFGWMVILESRTNQELVIAKTAMTSQIVVETAEHVTSAATAMAAYLAMVTKEVETARSELGAFLTSDGFLKQKEADDGQGKEA